jgi:hypothetical protein
LLLCRYSGRALKTAFLATAIFFFFQDKASQKKNNSYKHGVVVLSIWN